MWREMQMDRKLQNLAKVFCIIAGLFFLLWVSIRQKEPEKKAAPEGEYISREDVAILLEAIGQKPEWEAAPMKAPEEIGEEELKAANDTFFTYAQYRELYERIGGAEKEIPDYSEKYEPEYAMLKEDWYQVYHLMLAYFDTDSAIWKTTIFILKVDPQEKKLYTQNSEYTYVSSSFAASEFSKEEVYVRGNELLTSIQVLDEKTILENVWVLEVTGEEGGGTGESGKNGEYGSLLECFYHQIHFTIKTEEAATREQIVNLTFAGKELIQVEEKREKIRGKLLSVSEDKIEIEGYGVYETEENLEIYKLYGTLESQKPSDLMIGYDYTDFVLWDQKVSACLVSREGELDQIRVMLKNAKDNTYFYEEAIVEADGQQTTVRADEMQEGERLSFQNEALTDKVKMVADGMEKEDDFYRGKLEFYRMEEGMVIINELPLEEYLYAVVPSEMPASYPLEALKAQAVCARTYACRFIRHAGLAKFGAHLDNTTSYQVYHNIAENAATTTAVKETAGMMLYYRGELADNYYYSTSCGYGTDTTIWKSESEEPIPYMRASKLAPSENLQGAKDAGEMMDEETFCAFILTVDEADFEKEEPWYRWKYEAKQIDTEAMTERLKERYQVNAALILTRQGQGEDAYYVSEPISDIGTLQDIVVSKRGAGGIAEEMIITGSKAQIKVISEYNIRRILCDGETRVVRQDSSSVVAGTLLPSAFFVIEPGKSGEDVVGYTLTGGGYGHGVGMSQNGAKEMGSLGYSYQEILENFFTDCEVRG